MRAFWLILCLFNTASVVGNAMHHYWWSTLATVFAAVVSFAVWFSYPAITWRRK
jgi:hypothetical protein